MSILDLTHTLSPHIPVYPGDPQPIFTQNNIVENDGFTSHTLTLGTHVGTHIDAPAHMIPNGKKISDYPATHFIGKGMVIDTLNQDPVDAYLLNTIALHEIEILLLYTGRDKYFNSPEYFTQYPHITLEFAHKLLNTKVKVLGMDQASPDYAPFATHRLLLENDILIIENLTNLDQLINKVCTIYALPTNLPLDAAPVRVIAQINDN